MSARSRSGSIRSAAASHSSPARRSHQISAGCSGVAVGAGGDEPVELRAERQRGDLAPAGRRAQPRQRGDERRRPLPGVLLGPAGVRVAERVRLVARRDQRPVGLERLRAGALRADVDADDERRAQCSSSPGPRRRSVNVKASARWCSRETSTATPSAVRSTWSIVSSSVPRGTSSRRATSPSALLRRQLRDAVVDGQAALGERGVDRAARRARAAPRARGARSGTSRSRRRPGGRRRCARGAASSRARPPRRRAPRRPRPERARRRRSPRRCRAASRSRAISDETPKLRPRSFGSAGPVRDVGPRAVLAADEARPPRAR